MRFLKIKSKTKLDQFLTYKKGNLGPVFNFTAYIYIYAGELVLVPRFGLSRVRNSTTSRVRNSTTFWGDHFRTTKIGFVDFCDKIWCQLVFFCFLFWAQLVTSYLLFIIFAKKHFGQRGQKSGFFFVFQKKHYKNSFFFKRVPLPVSSKNLFYQLSISDSQKCVFIKISVFWCLFALKPLFL